MRACARGPPGIRPGGRSLRVLEEWSRRLVVFTYAFAAVSFWIELVGGAWDIEWHLAGRAEFFWTMPHVVLYAGIGLTFAACAGGLVLGLFGPPAPRGIQRGLRIALLGGLVKFAAGLFDAAWHARFGQDDALSPPHLVMIAGMNVVGVGLIVGYSSLLRAKGFWRGIRGTWRGAAGVIAPVAGTAWLFAVLGFAWIFSHPGFIKDPLLPSEWQRTIVATTFAAILALVTMASRGLLGLRWTGTALLSLYGASVAALDVLMAQETAATFVALPLFATSGLLMDLVFAVGRPGQERGFLVSVAGAIVGASTVVLLRIPTQDMTGGLFLNPPTILAAYALGGVLGALAGLQVPRLLRVVIPVPKAAGAPDAP